MRMLGRSILFAGMLALLAAPSALAGTATFAGSNNDTQAQLEGTWVSYLPDGISNPWLGTNPGGEADGITTNLTSLCGGPKALPDVGTITVTLAEPNWDWADYWWGAWLEMQFKVGSTTKLAFCFGSPYDWAPYDWVYIYFGDPNTTGLKVAWNQTYFGSPGGNEPIGVRLTSDGTDITLAASKDGINFTDLPGASWPINNLPGTLGDMTAEALSLEIQEYGPCATISKFEWTAESVPCLNAPQSVAGCTGDAASTFSAFFEDFGAVWPTFTPGVFDGPDHNWDAVADPYQLALATNAICDRPDVEAVYAANLVIAKQLLTDDYWGWGYSLECQSLLATQIAAEALWDSGKGAINWYFWIFDPEASALQSVPGLTADGDYDGDGITNAAEYDAVVASGGSPAAFVSMASNFWSRPDSAGLPAAGIVGLAALMAGCAAVGARVIRRKK